MSDDLSRARALLQSGGYTCVLCRKEETAYSKERGIQPLLSWWEEGRRFSGFCAADRVVGKAAACLYVLLGVQAVYACVMSEAAQKLLLQNGIAASASTLTAAIRNRLGDGLCPMEAAVRDIEEPKQAPARLRARLQQLQAASGKAGTKR